MEVISYKSPPSSSRLQEMIPLCTKHRILCTKVRFRSGSLGLSNKHHLIFKNVYYGRGSRPFKALEGFNNVETKILSGNYNGVVIGIEDDVGRMSKTGESVTKVSVPGLPDESNGECSAEISNCFWQLKPKFNVDYEKSGSKNVNSPPVLLLPGLGIGQLTFLGKAWHCLLNIPLCVLRKKVSLQGKILCEDLGIKLNRGKMV